MVDRKKLTKSIVSDVLRAAEENPDVLLDVAIQLAVEGMRIHSEPKGVIANAILSQVLKPFGGVASLTIRWSEKA